MPQSTFRLHARNRERRTNAIHADLRSRRKLAKDKADFFYGSLTNSTRRLFWRPSAEVLGHDGLVEPNPADVTRPKSKSRVELLVVERGVAQISTVRLVFDEMMPFGRSIYPVMTPAE